MSKRMNTPPDRTVILMVKNKGGVGSSHLTLATATTLRAADGRRENAVRNIGANPKGSPHGKTRGSAIELAQPTTEKGA